MVYNIVMKKIGILGGTFDPINNGHIYLAQTALESCKLDKVVFLPLNVPPHKKAPTADSKIRYELVSKAIGNTLEFIASDMEINRKGTTYTVDTLTEIKNINTDWDIYYIIGTDSLYDLHKWKDINKLFKLCTFVCMSRPGTDINNQEQYAARLAKSYGGSIIVLPSMGKNVSSTLIRRASSSELSELVPLEIIDDVKKFYVKEEL